MTKTRKKHGTGSCFWSRVKALSFLLLCYALTPVAFVVFRASCYILSLLLRDVINWPIYLGLPFLAFALLFVLMFGLGPILSHAFASTCTMVLLSENEYPSSRGIRYVVATLVSYPFGLYFTHMVVSAWVEPVIWVDLACLYQTLASLGAVFFRKYAMFSAREEKDYEIPSSFSGPKLEKPDLGESATLFIMIAIVAIVYLLAWHYA